MSQPNGDRKNPAPKPPPAFTKPKSRKQDNGQQNQQNGQGVARRTNTEVVRSVPLEKPQVEIPKSETSDRTAQLNFRVTPDFRRWFGSQIKFICAESGLKENQVSALTVQVLGNSLDEIRYRALLMAGLIEPPPNEESSPAEQHGDIPNLDQHDSAER